MPTFDELRRQLLDARKARAESSRALFLATERLARTGRAVDSLVRHSRDSHDEERRALEEEKRRLEVVRRERHGIHAAASSELASISDTFHAAWTDPRLHTGLVTSHTPIVLFPVRLETRFKTVTVGETEHQELWVRVYPDECLVDTFEETLASAELDSATIFWREYFHAAGSEALERAAWRGLVGSHGSGRSSWIVKHFRPRNPLVTGDPDGNATLPPKPSSRAASDVLLVVALEEGALAANELNALAAYWPAVWKANGLSAPEAAASSALATAVGASRARELARGFRPYNFVEAPPSDFTHATATPRVVYMVLPSRDDVDTKSRSWTKPASAELLPERFVLLGYKAGREVLSQLGAPVDAPFMVSPDPQADPNTQFVFDADGNLTLGDDLRWMTDFDEAVTRGMGFRVVLSREHAGGFDRLFVLGLRLSADAATGQGDLETLFTHHYFSHGGFALLPQGSATNNTEEGNSAHSRGDESDASYDYVFKGKAQFAETDSWLEKRDGQYFAEALGMETEWLKQIPHAGGIDQREARAMNTALWPATLGYFMDTLLQPVFDDDQLYYTRAFFTQFVSGRGAVPAIRIGRQPYGILPTTAYSRIGWIDDRPAPAGSSMVWLKHETRVTPFGHWMAAFKRVLDRMRPAWNALAVGVAHVDARSENPHQTLLDILGLHPASVEFYQRYANTKEQEHNIALIWHMAIPWATLPANELHDEAYAVLTQLGYSGAARPQLFDLFWKVSTNYLDGPAIQVGALSETDPLRVATTNGRNYIQWLAEWARVSFDAVRVQDGFQDNVSPNALLYILLKHALELGYHDAGVRVLAEAGLLDEGLRDSLRREPHFFHIQEPAASVGVKPGKSRYELLYSTDSRITGDRTTLLVDHITSRLGELFGTRYLFEQIKALETLAKTPTARLERLLAEHLDCGGYRLDAWMSGLVNFQLASLRQSRRVPQDDGTAAIAYRKGIHIGAYGWLEGVRPADRQLSPVTLGEELHEIFNVQQVAGQQSPLVTDERNEGYIHAPSLNHAVTASVLRSAYLANATPAQPDLLKVNLTSERVRKALAIVEGIRQGQSLGALLGYEFERGLHDRYTFAECDKFIFPLRLVFPLYTPVGDLPEGTSIQSIEARNVLNGLNLVRHVRNAADADKSYPFGLAARLRAADPDQRKAIDAEVDRLLDIHDAVADLAIAEGVHQVVMGNYARAAATLDAYSQATFPPIPDVVQTPRSGIAITHRVGVHFETNVSVGAGDGPRVRAEPSMNRWIAGILPPLDRIGCTVSYLDATTGLPKTTHVTVKDLGLQPLDLMYVAKADGLEANSALGDLIADVVLRDASLAVRPDLLGTIAYAEGAPAGYSFFEAAPFLRSLQALLLHSRPLKATDAALPTEAKADSATANIIDRARVDFLPSALTAESTATLAPLETAMAAVFPTAGPDKATILSKIDDYLSAISTACRRLASYGLPQTGFGIFQERRAGVFTSTLRKAAAIEARWQEKLDQYDALLATLPGLPTDAQKFELLLAAERLVSSASTDTTGKTVAQVQALVGAKRTALATRQAAFASLQKTTVTKVSALVAAFKALLPLTDFETEDTGASDIEDAVIVLAQDIAARTAQLIKVVDTRIAGLQEKLTAHDDASAADVRLQLLTDAGHLVFGDEFVLVPTFALPGAQANEWTNAYVNRAHLLRHHTATLLNASPVDDWMYGAARVRDKLHHVENLTFLAEAFQRVSPELRALQFPYAADAYWMAIEYPADAKKDLERELLLYTAHYPVDFDGTKRQCGLLLDEWTEVIPSDTETTGLAFHFDKPNAEPPQAMLLALPAQADGSWVWADLVATLHDTLDMARLRAVGPRDLDRTSLSVFLPATILATTWQPITIGADLSLVNKYVSKML